MRIVADAGSGSNTNIHPNTRRTAWMAARARNAAKRGGLIASVGLLAVATTLMLLVLVPREVNRTVRARIDALPPIADTLPLQANLTGAMDRLRNAEATLQLLRQTEADRVASATANATPASNTTPLDVSDAGQQTEARNDLIIRVSRARTAPLVENYRAVGEAELLRTDARARVLLDSLNKVSRDREAYAALGGPDARYAAMTAKLGTLGQRLVVVADQRLASMSASGTSRPATAPNAAVVSATVIDPPAVSDTAQRGGQGVLPPLSDAARLAQPQQFSGDTIAEQLARQSLDTAKAKLQLAEKMLVDARASNTRIAEARAQAEADAPARIPPVAMLFAALVTGLAAGFGCAFFIEVKRPRVADAAEVERVTDARVIVHSRATSGSRKVRSRRRADEGTPPVINAASEAYQLLHVTLTGYGDTAREIEIISNDALLGATIGINLAAAAVRDARATLLVDAGPPPRLVNRLLRITGGDEKTASAAPLQSQLVKTRIGRDLSIDTLTFSTGASEAATAQLQELANEHDFTVVIRSDITDPAQASLLPTTDVILCARMGVTRLDWLIRKTAELRAQHHRVRAVLLWATRAPSIR